MLTADGDPTDRDRRDTVMTEQDRTPDIDLDDTEGHLKHRDEEEDDTEGHLKKA